MREPVRPPLARVVALVVVLVAACSDQRLTIPTAPSHTPGALARFETDDGIAVAGPRIAGPLAVLSIDPSVFKGGGSTGGTVTLSTPAPAGGTTVTLVSDDSLATVPGTITLPAGATTGTFTIATKPVAADVRIRITASAGSGSLTSLMRITPENGIASLSVSPARIPAGGTATGTVTLASDSPAGGTVVRLDSSNNDARVPDSVTVAAVGRSATFTIETYGVSRETEVWIGALLGRDRREVQIRVLPPNGGGGGTVTIGGVVE